MLCQKVLFTIIIASLLSISLMDRPISGEKSYSAYPTLDIEPAGKGKKPPKKTTIKKRTRKKSQKKPQSKTRIKTKTRGQKASKKAKSKRKKTATSKKKSNRKAYRKNIKAKKKPQRKIKKQSKKKDLTKEKKQLFKAANSRHVRNGKKNKEVTMASQKMSKHADYFGFKKMDDLRKVYTSEGSKNRLAAAKIKKMLREGKRSEGPPSGHYKTGYISYTLPNGHYASWHKGDGRFGGFRGPSIHKNK